MNFRKLIEKAMHEAQSEFADIVTAKLAALMGDAEAKPRRGRPPGSKTAKVTGRVARNRSRGQRRAAPEHMAKIQDRVLAAMTVGEPMKKGAIMRAARLAAEEDVRVRNVLAKLKSAGVVSMKGVRGSAVYTLKAS